MLHIGEIMAHARRQRLRGTPEGHDIVVEFGMQRDLDQHHRAFAPTARRFDPGRGAQLIPRLGVLIRRKVAPALHQPEPMRIAVGECRDLQRRRVRQHPPQLLPAAGQHLQPVAVVDRRAIIVEIAAVARPEPEHRGQWRDSHLGQIAAGDQRGAGGHQRVGAAPDHEFERAGDRAAVEQRVDGDGARVGVGGMDPEFVEGGEFLALGAGGAQRQTAAGQPIAVAPAQHPEIAGALEHREFIQIARPVQRRTQPEP